MLHPPMPPGGIRVLLQSGWGNQNSLSGIEILSVFGQNLETAQKPKTLSGIEF